MTKGSDRPADRDTAFLNSDDTRGVRLELEYLKAELLLRRHGVRHTVLVMGSTRASRRHAYYRVAREFGRIVGRARHAAVMTGGGPGIMEAANRGALEVGGLSIGLNIELPRAQVANRYSAPGLSLSFRYFALRKLHFLLRARAMVAFPGGFGTFDELFETLTLVQCRKIEPMPIVLVGEAYWRRAVDFEFLVSAGMIHARDRRLYCYAESARGDLERYPRLVPPRGRTSVPFLHSHIRMSEAGPGSGRQRTKAGSASRSIAVSQSQPAQRSTSMSRPRTGQHTRPSWM